MSHARAKSLATSLATTVVDVGLFALSSLLLAGAALALARWICGMIGAACNFTLNRTWAFRRSSGQPWGQAWRYAVTALLSVTLGTLLWWGMRLATGFDPRLLHLASLGLIWLVFTFPMLRGWVFQPR